VAADSTLLDIGILRQMHQFGDSITFGSGPGATSVNTELMHVAAQLGFIGSTHGISGLTIVGCSALLDNVLPLHTITSDDVAVLAIGGNSMADGFDQTDLDAYAACIAKLKAKGYGKILCRAVLAAPDGSSPRQIENAPLKAIVDGLNDPDVIWIPTHTWTGYQSQDNTHPTDNGYVTIDGFALPAYASALGL
jgi:lysophospholipase L1-like esterase